MEFFSKSDCEIATSVKGELYPKNELFLNKSKRYAWKVDFKTYFLHVALRDFSKNYFVRKFWPQYRGAELGVSADIFRNYDVSYGEGLKYGVLFCRRQQK